MVVRKKDKKIPEKMHCELKDLAKKINDFNNTHEIIYIINRIIDSLDDIVKNQSWILKTLEKLIDRVKSLSTVITFILWLLIFTVYLRSGLEKIISNFIAWWPQISEGWQIFIVSIPVFIFIHIAGNYFWDKLKNKITSSNTEYPIRD